MKKSNQITLRQARLIGDCLYLDWEQVDIEQFRQGLMGCHREAGTEAPLEYPQVLQAGKTVLAHMQQFPNYFVRVAKLRAEARAASGRKRPATAPSSV